MCGIFGVVTPRGAVRDHTDFMTDAFQAGQVRGLHGSGIFSIGFNGSVDKLSRSVDGTTFIHEKEVESILKCSSNSRVLVGHNRFTTSGGNSDDDCHPFEFGDVIGVHNGGVPDDILKTIDPNSSHSVDSGRVFAALSRVDDPMEVLHEISSGNYALVWYDKRKHSLFMARNGGRPMHVIDTSQGLFFASEMGMLTWLLARNRVPVTGAYVVGSLNEHCLYQIPLDDPREVTATDYEVRQPVVKDYRNNGTGYGEWWKSQGHGNYSSYTSFNSRARMSYPADGKFRSYFETAQIVADFPSLRPIVDRIVANSGQLRDVHAACFGTAVNMEGKEVGIGFLCDRDGENVHYDIPVAVNYGDLHSDKVKYDRLFGEVCSNDTYRCPVINVARQRLLVTPEGNITVYGYPNFPYHFDDYEFTYCVGRDLSEGWAKDVVQGTYVKSISKDVLASMWARLEDMVDFNSDIPF